LEIEKVLLDPEVKGVAVIPVINDHDGHHPMALIIPKEGSKVKNICIDFRKMKEIYRVTHFNLGSQKTRKLSPANKNVSDKSCMVSRGP